METSNQSYEFRGMIKSSAKKDPNSKTSNDRSRNSKKGNLWLFFGTLSLVYCLSNMIIVTIKNHNDINQISTPSFLDSPDHLAPSQSRQTSPRQVSLRPGLKDVRVPVLHHNLPLLVTTKLLLPSTFPPRGPGWPDCSIRSRYVDDLSPAFPLQGDSYSHKWYLEPLSIWTSKYWFVKSGF